ncbi:MAG: hypothetical protein ABSB49_01605 [Polyangia bacterium]
MSTKRRSASFVITLVLLAALAAWGAIAYAFQLSEGDGVTGLAGIGQGGAVWGLYVVLDGCFLGTGVALMAIACLARFVRGRALEPMARVAMPCAIACFLGAALAVSADQGRPALALVDLSLYARAQSPMFTTFTTVAGVCLLGSLVHCVLARRPDLAEYAKSPSFWRLAQRALAAGYRGTPTQRYRRQQAGFWMSLALLLALLAPAVALALLFTVRPARSLAPTVLEAAAFLALSLGAGLGLLLLAASLVERLAAAPVGLPPQAFARLGRWLMATAALSVLLVVAAELASMASGEAAVRAYARGVLRDYGVMFWATLVALWLAGAVLWWDSRRRRSRRAVLLLASGLAGLACLLHHDWSLIGWQTHGLALPYQAGSYAPTWVEGSVAMGLFATCLLLLLPAVRLIPFAPAAVQEGRTQKPRDLGRKLLTGLWLAVGLAASGAGLAGSARVGTEPFLDPPLPGSPLIFVAGLVMMATAGALYEILPERKG